MIKKTIIKLFSDKDIEHEYIVRFNEDQLSDSLDEDAAKQVLQDLSKVDNMDDFLLSTLKNDRMRFFNAPVESHNVIKGAFLRTLWLLKEIRNKRKVEEKVANVKYTNPRQG